MMKKKIDIIVPSWIPAVFLCPWVIPSYDASRYIHCSILFHHLYSVWEKDQRGNNFSNDEYLYVLIIKKTNIQWTYVTLHTHIISNMLHEPVHIKFICCYHQSWGTDEWFILIKGFIFSLTIPSPFQSSDGMHKFKFCIWNAFYVCIYAYYQRQVFFLLLLLLLLLLLFLRTSRTYSTTINNKCFEQQTRHDDVHIDIYYSKCKERKAQTLQVYVEGISSSSTPYTARHTPHGTITSHNYKGNGNNNWICKV